MLHYLKNFFDGWTSGEKIASTITTMCTWFGGLFLFDAPSLQFALKGVMWLGALVVSAIIPKVVNSIYDNRMKETVDKFFKPKKNAKEKSNKRAA